MQARPPDSTDKRGLVSDAPASYDSWEGFATSGPMALTVADCALMLEVMSGANDFFFDSVSQIRMPSWSKGRVALVGDAAAAPSFLAGQGSALGMVEGYTLATELAGNSDHREAFARYHERLAPLLRSKQDAAQGLGLAFAPKNRFQLFIRNTVLKMMGLPKVADIAMGRSFHDAVELPAFPEAGPIR